MRWEPLLLIALTACLSGLLIIMTGKKFHWLALVILGYFTGLATILFTPVSVYGTALYVMPLGAGRVNLTQLNILNWGFLENIILTVPIGLLLKWFWPKLSLLTIGGLGLLVGSSIEIGQYVLSQHWLINRSSDINDVLANAIGIIIGGLLVTLYYRLSTSRRSRVRLVA
ncbi:VanZ family protein [Levilactobacillus brevis]|uniref:VanZ family protein n=2 Tax=Levilactobacillus brevis TaxID=1580 RepID=UPI0020742581|nr:VanZ family protein [Levilactobacillus brevis]MCM6797466.1 VanZ family protein [Levilactobacillus brevis]MCT3573529.1 VanZ family protein [Levilactobacillus brevis]